MKPQSNYAIQKAIRDRPDLTMPEKAVAFTLTTYRNRADGKCFPSQDHLAHTLGMHRQRLNQIIASLKQKKVLKIVKIRPENGRKKTVSNYVFLPQPMSEKSDTNLSEISDIP